MFLSAIPLTKSFAKPLFHSLFHNKKAQEGEGGGSGGSIWFWVTVALFLICLAVFGYLIGREFLANPGAIMAKITNALGKIKNIGG